MFPPNLSHHIHAWQNAPSAQARAQAWADALPHVGAHARMLRSFLAKAILPHEMALLLQSPHGDAFLHEIHATTTTWLLNTPSSVRGHIALTLARHAPWDRPQHESLVFGQPWSGCMRDALGVAEAMLLAGLDAPALGFAQILQRPLPHLAHARVVSGRTPLYARHAYGAVENGTGAHFIRPEVLAEKLAQKTLWSAETELPLLALAWRRGVEAKGWVEVRNQGRLDLCTLTGHQRMRFLAAMDPPYARVATPAVAAILGIPFVPTHTPQWPLPFSLSKAQNA